MDDERSHRFSEASDATDASGDYYDDDDREKSSTQEDTSKRKISDFDEYKFTSPIVDDDDDASKSAEAAADAEADRFLEMAKLKTTDYSRMDLVKLASAMGGLNIDDRLVEPVQIPESEEERTRAVRTIYGSETTADSEPIQDPVKVLETTSEEDAERIRSPPNLYEALQSSFLKSNYKSSIYRLIILGSHDENLSHLIEYNKEITDFINVQSYTEPLNGVLCVYEYYYIHVVEGSEDNLIRLLERYASDLDPSGFEWDLKFHPKTGKYSGRENQRFHTVQSWVLGIFKIQERRFNSWRGEKVFPNRMHLSDVPSGGFREKYFHFLKQCLIMAFTYSRMAPGQFNPAPENNEEYSAQLKKTIERAKIQRFKSLGKVVPPVTFIQYVLDHRNNPKLKIRTVREHLDLFGSTPSYISSSNTEWPPPGRIAPYD